MFCTKCGTQMDAADAFCPECGLAVAQPQYTPPQSQPAQPVAELKAGVNIVYPDGHNEIGDLYFSATTVRFVKKSKAVRVAFGFLGSAMENGEQVLHFPVSEIVSGQKTRIGLNGNVYQIPGDAEAWDSPVPGSILGALWLASILHPDLLADGDSAAIMDEYYETFYNFTYSEK